MTREDGIMKEKNEKKINTYELSNGAKAVTVPTDNPKFERLIGYTKGNSTWVSKYKAF